MTAVVFQIRDYQSKKDIERMQRELEKEAAELTKEFNRMAESGTEVVCAMNTVPSEYVAPSDDCA